MRLHLVSLKARAHAAEEGAETPLIAEHEGASAIAAHAAAGGSIGRASLAANVVTQHIRTARVRGGTDDISPGELAPGIARHSRYLSDYQDDAVRLDVSHHQNRGTHIITIDIRNQLVACNGGRSHYREPQPLTKFPEAVDAFKVALNRALERHHKGTVRTAVLECRRSFLRIFAWMSRNCIYRLADLNRELIEMLVGDLAEHGWDGALRQTELLRKVIERSKSDIDLFGRIYNRYRNAAAFSLPIEELEAIVGMPLYEWSIPRLIYEEFAALEGDERPIRKEDMPRTPGASRYAIRDLMTALNALSLSTPGSIPFLPFPNIHVARQKTFKAAQKRLKATIAASPDDGAKAEHSVTSKIAQRKGPPSVQDARDGQLVPDDSEEPMGRLQKKALQEAQGDQQGKEHTEGRDEEGRPTVNLTLDECVRIFSEALRWTYDYSPAILKTLEFARERLKGLGEKDNYAQKKAWNEVYTFYEAEAAVVNLPFKSIAQRNQGAQSLRKVVKTLQYALFVNFGINSARRVNELIGKRQVPYGLYLGALSKVWDEPAIYRVDSYVSKGPMAWFSFPANRLMADAYGVLEELYKLHEPYDAAEPDKTLPPEAARKRKLFTSRDITPGALKSGTPREQFNASEREEFLDFAGVDPKRFERSITPFRRMFSVLFMHRYDLREHPALQTYLGHLDAATTGGYYHDRAARAPGESIRELHAPDYVDDKLLEELNTADLEYLAEQLLRMLNGEAIAGGFPVVVAKLTRQMSSEASFAELSSELKAGVLAQRLHDKGHRCTPMPHVCCMAGEPERTGELAKCYHDGSLHREEASPKQCSGCVHQLASNAYLESIKAQAAESERSAAATGLPAAVRQGHERRVEILRNVLTAEHRAGQRNMNLFVEAQKAWEATAARCLHRNNGSSDDE